MSINVGEVGIVCPECSAEIPVSVSAELTADDEGRQYLACDPDMSDLWAHMWTHDGGSNDE